MQDHDDVARDLGEQPLARLMAERGLFPRDLVAASDEQITHKMVARAMKGRRLTANTMGKVRRAWNRASGNDHARVPPFCFSWRAWKGWVGGRSSQSERS